MFIKHTLKLFSQVLFKGENSTAVISLSIRLISSCIRTLVSPFASNLINAKHDLTLQFDSSVNEVDIHSRSQDHGKAGTCAVILFA